MPKVKRASAPIIAIDFFCGAGGFTRGLLNAGIEVLLGVDINPDCRATYERNNKPAKFLCKSVADIGEKDLPERILSCDKKNILFVGCAPCQPFSKQRRRSPRSGKDAGRKKRELDGTLLLAFGRAIEKFKPGHVLVENVPGIAEVPGNSTYRRFIRMLDRLGYKIDKKIIDAKNYGVPQSRRRFILAASKVFIPELPRASFGPGKKPYVTVRDVLFNYPKLDAGESHPTVTNHLAPALGKKNLKRIIETPKDGGSRRAWSGGLVLKCHKNNYDGHTDVYGRMAWDRPAPTLTCRCCSISNGRFGHPEQNRAISFREAARLQTFDDNFYFIGPSAMALGELIGNAVPVKLAESLGRKMIRLQAKAASKSDNNVRTRR